MSQPVNDEATDLGTCCMCETSDDVQNIVMLDKKAIVPGHGWGCFQCGLSSDGAVAVLCDGCLKKYQFAESELKFACRGYPASEGRIEIEKLTDEHEHDMSKHPDEGMDYVCEDCGCTDSTPCKPDGCFWVKPNLCSACFYDDADDF